MTKFDFTKKISTKVILKPMPSLLLYTCVYISFWIFSPNYLIMIPERDSSGHILSTENVNMKTTLPILSNSILFMIVFYIIIHTLGIKTSLFTPIYNKKKKKKISISYIVFFLYPVDCAVDSIVSCAFVRRSPT